MGWQLSQLLGFAAFWWLAVLGGTAAEPWLLSLLLLHFLFTPTRRQDGLALLPGLVGFSVDALLTQLGVFAFASPWPPLWLALLWCGFAVSLPHAAPWLWQHRTWLPWLGAVLGPASYLGAWKLGAVELPLGGAVTGLLLAGLWALWLPLLVRLLERASKPG